MTFETWFQSIHDAIPIPSAHAVLKLTEEGGTIPFIARYRKEQTGNLDEVAIARVIDGKERWDEIIKRQTFIVEEIERQGKLTDELRGKILTTFNLDSLEDIYLPYKQKRKTKATVAKEAGLEPLANWIWDVAHGMATPEAGQTLEAFALAFYNAEMKINDAAAAISGAQDILTERLAETVELREHTRKVTFERGAAKTSKTDKAKPHSKFERYFDYFEPIQSLLKPEASHRYLAMRRGWMEEELSLTLGAGPEDPDFDLVLQGKFDGEASPATVANAECEQAIKDVLLKSARMALKAYVLPSIETEVHRSLKDIADEAAIKVFAENVRKLLLAAPFGAKAVLGVDPGIRTGCKLAVVDDSGKYVASDVIHLQSPSEQERAKRLLAEVVGNANIRAIAVGNGTAGRETETFVREALKEAGLNVPVVMVNESGASIYSASEIAREEFPDLDLTIRGAISIARRLQDPLAELVKTDPKSIGVGQYQHDVNQPALKKSLDLVVDVCVNSVGVNLNTASSHLLARVSGIGPSMAKKIVEHRGTKGLFESRQQLLDIPRFSAKVFEQAAGFLRIPNSQHPLDNTGVHPERYPALEQLAAKLGKGVGELTGSGVALVKQAEDLKAEVGDFTFTDIIAELAKPGRDPREEFSAFAFREDIHHIGDLTAGMICPGIVTNVTNFGAFVDIGVHQDGLAHISQLSNKFVKDPREVVNPGDRVTVRVMEVNLEKQQIALTMRTDAETSRQMPRDQQANPQERRNDRGKDRRDDRNNRQDKPQDNRPPRPEKPSFNNPFAEQLAKFKK
ncbi:MAG: RNA-binding transcriptional accessory protein [Acidobacteriota bacterium]|nr:RNA-binding transcriptional accessory protein [Acidobacteriota bacterium]